MIYQFITLDKNPEKKVVKKFSSDENATSKKTDYQSATICKTFTCSKMDAYVGTSYIGVAEWCIKAGCSLKRL